MTQWVVLGTRYDTWFILFLPSAKLKKWLQERYSEKKTKHKNWQELISGSDSDAHIYEDEDVFPFIIIIIIIKKKGEGIKRKTTHDGDTFNVMITTKVMRFSLAITIYRRMVFPL
jgi:hypothetical protein